MGGLGKWEQRSVTAAESNLEDEQATFFNNEGSSSMSHTPQGLTQCGM